MAEHLYTHGRWLVKAGREEDFISAWKELAEWTSRSFESGRGLLLRDRDDPRGFFSFGPWPDLETIERWRGSDGFQERVGRIRELLESFEAVTLDWAAES